MDHNIRKFVHYSHEIDHADQNTPLAKLRQLQKERLDALKGIERYNVYNPLQRQDLIRLHQIGKSKDLTYRLLKLDKPIVDAVTKIQKNVRRMQSNKKPENKAVIDRAKQQKLNTLLRANPQTRAQAQATRAHVQHMTDDDEFDVPAAEIPIPRLAPRPSRPPPPLSQHPATAPPTPQHGQGAGPSRPHVSQGAGPSTSRVEEIEEVEEEEEEAEEMPEPSPSMGKRAFAFFKSVGADVMRKLTPKGVKSTTKTLEGVNRDIRQKAVNEGLPVSLASGRGSSKRTEQWLKANKQEREQIFREYELRRPLLEGFEEEAGPSTKNN